MLTLLLALSLLQEPASPKPVDHGTSAEADAKGNNAETNNDHQESEAGWIVAFTAVIAVMSVAQFGAMIAQWRMMRRQSDHIASAERAWVLVEIQEVPLYSLEESTDGDTTSIPIRIVCRNDGNTPAWVTDILFGMVIYDRDAIPRAPEINNAQRVGGDLTPVGPKSAMPPIDYTVECAGRNPIYFRHTVLFGVVRYRDVFGEARETHIGYEVKHKRLVRLPIPAYYKAT